MQSSQGKASELGVRRALPPALLALVVSFTSCDSVNSLLEVDLPGQVVDADLDNPELAETLVLSAQADFECGFQAYLMVTGSWAQEIQYVHSGQYIPLIRYDQRSFVSREHVGPCKGTGAEWHISWFPQQLARAEAADAIARIQAFPSGSVEDPDFLIGKAYAYQAYSTLLLSEAFCGIVLDGDGVDRDRSEGFQIAEDLFTSAIAHSGMAASSEAADIVSLSYVGRARTRLNLGDSQGVLDDAALVPPGFTYYATYDQTPTRRQSLVQQLNGEWYTIHPRYHNLNIDGVPDPRVPTVQVGTISSGADYWQQQKYANAATDIPFASWREAQLMIAEVEGGQTAVGIINQLRATVEDLPWVTGTHNLPQFSSTDDGEILAQVLEERHRELFLQGTKLGDDLRTGWHVNWDSDITPMGRPYGDGTCMPVPDLEFL